MEQSVAVAKLQELDSKVEALHLSLQSIETVDEINQINAWTDINKQIAELKILVNQTYRYVENCLNNANFRVITFILISFSAIGGVWACYAKWGLKNTIDKITKLVTDPNLFQALINSNTYKGVYQELLKRESGPIVVFALAITNIGISAAYQLGTAAEEQIYFRKVSGIVFDLKETTSTFGDSATHAAADIKKWKTNLNAWRTSASTVKRAVRYNYD